MSYSCSDFTEEILSALAQHNIIDEKLVPADLRAQATIVRIGIKRFVAQHEAMITFSERELATILAALRNWQIDSLNEDMEDEYIEYFRPDIGPAFNPLNDDEIDALCERINV